MRKYSTKAISTTNREDHFWSKVARLPGDGCWEWTDYRKRNGYGQFYVRRHPVYAHRFSYELTHGPIPNGLFVLHRCDNPPCVRPDHLFLGDQSVNMLDAIRKGRRVATVPEPPGGRLRGADIGNSKLTDEQVTAIRRRYASGGITQEELAAECGVTRSAISAILLRKCWRHIS